MLPFIAAMALTAGQRLDYSDYKLVWHDESNKPGAPDPKNWVFEQGFVRNNEMQWYQPQNAVVKDGHLIIEGRRENVANMDYVPNSKDWRKAREHAEYTSACLETRGLHEFLYGRFEIRAKIDARPGLWPAIWSLGVHGRWPLNGEIDQLEFYRNTILANTCWANGTWNSQRTPYARFTNRDPNWAKKFHVWRMEWDEAFIRIYLDNQLMNETDLSKTVNPDGSNPFHQPEFFLLDLAIGSTGGDPSKTEFPARFEVDYIRVFQKVK
ncbi:MAG: glycoside hydrolase family 16 protein [Fimbriimonas sp.]|nr:glycoside hydrolase family 16 protein [Fimbriimonas sp.]